MGRRKKVRKRTGAGSGATGETIGKASAGTGEGETILTCAATGGIEAGSDDGHTRNDGQEMERVGVVFMNTVDIDETRLTAEADAAVAGAPVDESAPVGAVQALPDSWSPLIEGMTPMLRIAVFPQWNISDAEATEFAESLGQCLDQIFPGGIAGPYACFVRLIVCCGGIVATRAIVHGQIPPLGPRRAKPEKETGTAADAAH